MASKIHFLVIEKKHTYLVTVHLQLGVGDIQLKHTHTHTNKQTKSISKLVNIHIQTQI